MRGSWSPGPGTTGDTVTHRREADPHPQLPAAADITAIQITRVRAKYFHPAPCEDVAAWASGGPPPPHPDTGPDIATTAATTTAAAVVWCAAAVAAGPNISQGS